MKITIFYSWQSDLPNKTNRGFIEDSIRKAKETILSENRYISEIEIVSDSRGDNGTPDLVSSIFNKIDNCDVFIADISIINPDLECRPSPNPNVLIELGYAAHTLGWNKLICLYNNEYAKIEMLPFDIRTRKPIIYNTISSFGDAKKSLTNCIVQAINNIADNVLIDKHEYNMSKRTVDLAMQAILIDFCKLLFDDQEKYNYNKLLMSKSNDIMKCLSGKKILGFYLFMNISKEIKEFINYFNDKLEMFFLSDGEKRILAKLVFALKSYDRLLHSESLLNVLDHEKQLIIIDAYKINPNNSKNSYILAKPYKNNEAVVVSGGDFEETSTEKLLNIYQLSEEAISTYSSEIQRIVEIVNEWICYTGKYFIANTKGI